jgi:hypothetical protein
MKIIKTLAVLVVFSVLSQAQNITNTIGTSGVFRIKDGTTTYFNIRQSDGMTDLSGNLRLVSTVSNLKGIIYKDLESFIHDFGGTGLGGNTFMGLSSGNFTLTTARYNTGIGKRVLSDITTGSQNTGTGFICLSNITTGSENSGYGSASLFTNSSGNFNSGFGTNSLYRNTTGSYNIAVGTNALYANTTGNYNCSVGVNSLPGNSIGENNVAIGYLSLQNNVAGYSNTGIGSNSMTENINGAGNTSVGAFSLTGSTTGDLNTAIGYQSASNIVSGNNNTLVGYNSEPSSSSVSNQITLGNNQVTSLRCNVTTITSLSDARDKKNIHDLTLGLDFISRLKPRMYNWDKREWYDNNVSDGSKMQDAPVAGFIAQELDEAQASENAGWLNLVLKDNPEKWEATPGNLLPVMVKAIQELKEENDRLRAEMNNLRSLGEKVTELEIIINEMKLQNPEIKTVSSQ